MVVHRHSFNAGPSYPEKGHRARNFSTSTEIASQVPSSFQHDNASDMLTGKPAQSSTSSVFRSLSKVGFQSVHESNELRRSRQSMALDPAATASGAHGYDRTPSDGASGSGSHDSLNFNDATYSELSLEEYYANTKSSKARSQNSIISDGSIASGRRSFKNAAKKLFRMRPSTRGYQESESQSPTHSTKTLLSQYGKHEKNCNLKTVAVINEAGHMCIRGKGNGKQEAAIPLIMEVQFDTNDVQMLHDLIKNMPNFEVNFSQFSKNEQHALANNIWGVSSNLLLSIMKNLRVWELPAKIEDINRVIAFYIKMKRHGKAATPGPKLFSEVNECLRASLYVLAGYLIHGGVDTKPSLKTFCAIWASFYKRASTNILAVLAPLETSFQKDSAYWNFEREVRPIKLVHIIYELFRDVIVLPYFQEFSSYYEGMSKDFQAYVANEDEQDEILQTEKLILLQCFGILASLDTGDPGQQIIEEMLTGVRLSI